jgi:hypothetical protein
MNMNAFPFEPLDDDLTDDRVPFMPTFICAISEIPVEDDDDDSVIRYSYTYAELTPPTDSNQRSIQFPSMDNDEYEVWLKNGRPPGSEADSKAGGSDEL